MRRQWPLHLHPSGDCNLRIGTEDGGEFTFKILFCHNGTPFLKVSNRGTQDMGFSKKRKNQIRFWKWSTVSGQVE